MEEILQCHLSDDVRTRLTEIKEQLKLYEDDAAEALLKEVIAQMEKEDI